MDKKRAGRRPAPVTFVVLASLVLAALGWAGVAAAQASPTDRQTASLTFSTVKPGAPTGSRFDVVWRNPDQPNNPDAKPPSVQTLVVSYAPGTIIDTSAVPQCTASDAELMLFGAGACPASPSANLTPR